MAYGSDSFTVANGGGYKVTYEKNKRFQFKFVRHLDYLSKICTHLRLARFAMSKIRDKKLVKWWVEYQGGWVCLEGFGNDTHGGSMAYGSDSFTVANGGGACYFTLVRRSLFCGGSS
ncbi:hypothetical protein DEO72_LG11g853 [Vigna unguiculata]|uniref:Uncharacterized protein n=1 Tax=Vigna unguiculata TaxID=3917 RepID=A0A4D6NNP8_VIGUN|nr:hypothetical protein DEO72_LG11g853 [Vigna unguiculata]